MIKVWIVLTIGINSGLVLANELGDARQKQVQAAQSFYKELRKLGPNATPEQITQIQQKTINPAQAGVANAITHVNEQRHAELRQSVIDIVKEKVRRAILPQFVLDRLQAGRKDTSVGASAKPIGNPYPDTDSAPKDDGPGLDGSNIPKEIYFPGKKKK